jgi:hypothetical protein
MVDLMAAPIIRDAFALDSTGAWTLQTLAVEM